MNLNPATNPDAQEALSRCYSNDIIILLPLRNGKFAIFNNARELCTIIENPADCVNVWKTVKTSYDILEDLGLR